MHNARWQEERGERKEGKVGSREGQGRVREAGVLKETGGGVEDLSVLTYSTPRRNINAQVHFQPNIYPLKNSIDPSSGSHPSLLVRLTRKITEFKANGDYQNPVSVQCNAMSAFNTFTNTE